jgi:hypothetical protein
MESKEGIETVETVSRRKLPRTTPLKRGVNKRSFKKTRMV